MSKCCVDKYLKKSVKRNRRRFSDSPSSCYIELSDEHVHVQPPFPPNSRAKSTANAVSILAQGCGGGNCQRGTQLHITITLQALDIFLFAANQPLHFHFATVFIFGSSKDQCYTCPIPKYFPKHLILKHPLPMFLSQSESPSFTTIQNNR
ncbi:hypothetical protein ANN_19040 [Periplaneta americana]|uniref:Uncharacterized protein n=1 Tax=Periplaneta americana TaxID=6978 RepID=A0ABQ8SQD4_PERAM|nr:hypothetical protein ANN_19040 [Periplaneta americana]